MPYTSTVWVSGSAPGIDAPELNNLETQYSEATQSFERDLFTPFVFGGGSFVATRDGSILSQLDVTSGVAFLLQSDNTLRRRANTSSTQSASGHPSTTLFLDLNPDGSWSWGTSHSGVSGHLTIASVTTDASANIASVTDARTLNTTLLSGMGGGVTLIVNSLAFAGGGQIDNEGAIVFRSVETGGSAEGFVFQSWTGSATANAFSIGGQFGSALSYVGAGGDIHDASGRVAVQGSHSSGQPALSYGAGAPASLASNEIYFQVS